MKILPLLAALAVLFVLAPSPAAAEEEHLRGRIVGYTPCGKPISQSFRVKGWDRMGRPFGDWVTNYPASCECGQRNRGSGSGSGSDRWKNYRDRNRDRS
jgi:hypothetical protein